MVELEALKQIMKTFSLLFTALWLSSVVGAVCAESKVVLVIHGGAASDRAKLTPEMDKRYRAGLEEAVKAGYEVFK